MPRLLAPRWLAAHALLVVVVAGCALLGWWQLDRARDQHAQSLRPAANAGAEPVALDVLLDPGERAPADAVGRPVVATGEYDVSSQQLVQRQDPTGEAGYAVVTPLVTAGPAVVVVRGWVPASPDGSPPSVPAPPRGPVRVTGVLGTGDEAPPVGASLPAGQLGSVHLASLVNLVPYPLYDAVLSRTAESPSAAEPLAVLLPAAAAGAGDWPLQNLFYAAEWWIFGLAAIAVWVSAVRREELAAVPVQRESSAA